MRSHSYENDFDLHENETARGTHFHMKGFALRLVLKQRHKRTRNWPIELAFQLREEIFRGLKNISFLGNCFRCVKQVRE